MSLRWGEDDDDASSHMGSGQDVPMRLTVGPALSGRIHRHPPEQAGRVSAAECRRVYYLNDVGSRSGGTHAGRSPGL